jgi:hypothetical protein
LLCRCWSFLLPFLCLVSSPVTLLIFIFVLVHVNCYLRWRGMTRAHSPIFKHFCFPQHVIITYEYKNKSALGCGLCFPMWYSVCFGILFSFQIYADRVEEEQEVRRTTCSEMPSLCSCGSCCLVLCSCCWLHFVTAVCRLVLPSWF